MEALSSSPRWLVSGAGTNVEGKSRSASDDDVGGSVVNMSF